MPVDRRQPVAVFCRLLARLQLGARPLFDARVIQMLIHAVERAEIVQQLHRRLFPDAGHTRDIVRRVSHQCLEVDQVNRIEAVLFTERRGIVTVIGGLPHFGRHEPHGCAAADQLQAVAVTRDHDALVAMLVRAAADRSDQVVRFVAGQFAAHNPHCVQHILNDRQLRG